MILSNNKDDSFLQDKVVIDETAQYNTSQELQEKTITTENQTNRINNTLHRAAYTLKDEADVFGIISRRLSAIGFPNLTKEKLEEETKAKLGDFNDLYTILKFIGETYDVKFIMHNGAKLPPLSVSFSSYPTYTVTFTIYYKESKWYTSEIESISDEQFLQTFADVESGNTLTDEDESISMINDDESRREHVKYPHTGPSIVYLRNNFFHGSTCLEHVNDLFPICKESVQKGKTNFFVTCDGGPDYHPKSYKNEMLYTKLWREAGLDQLVVTCNVAEAGQP